MLDAQNRHAISANTTESGSEPPAKATPAGIEAAIAAPGAMSVMLWNRTSRSPMAPRRSPGACCLAGSALGVVVMAAPAGCLRGDDLTARVVRAGPGRAGVLRVPSPRPAFYDATDPELREAVAMPGRTDRPGADPDARAWPP